MTRAHYTLADPIGSRATFGLIVLRTDETIEHDFGRFFRAPDIATYVTRIPSAAEVNAATLTAMSAELPAAARLLPDSVRFDAVGYGCTSASTLIGPEKVSDLVKSGVAVDRVTNPLSAALAAFSALGARRIGLVSPYVADVSAAMRAKFAENGVETVRFLSFEEDEEAKVARIHPDSIRDAAISVGEGNDIDAVFLSCTNLRTFDIIAETEAKLGKPVVSSNQALCWHMAQAAGVDTSALPFGRLMKAGEIRESALAL